MGTRHLKTLEIRKKTPSSTKTNKNQENKIKNIKVNQKKGECRWEKDESSVGTIDKIIVWPLGLGYEWSGLSLYVRTQVHRHNLRCR